MGIGHARLAVEIYASTGEGNEGRPSCKSPKAIPAYWGIDYMGIYGDYVPLFPTKPQ